MEKKVGTGESCLGEETMQGNIKLLSPKANSKVTEEPDARWTSKFQTGNIWNLKTVE